MKYLGVIIFLVFSSFLRNWLVFGCGSGVNTQILSNPTLSWTMNPPVTWTFPSITALQQQSFLPGQSLTQIQAQNTANGDITSAVIQSIASVGLSTVGIIARPTYTPPQINDCIKVGTGTQTQTVVGDTFGIVEQGSVVSLATSTAAINVAVCTARSFSNVITIAPFIQSGSVSIQGLVASAYQIEQISAQMMVHLNFNKNVRFVTEINANQN